MDYLRRMFAHLAWADDRALHSLRDATHPHEQARELLAHVLGAEHVWLSRVQGRPATVAVWPALSLDECEALARANHRAFDEYLSALDDEGLQRTVHYRNSAGAEFDSRVGDMLLQVALHGAYHRGQIALLVRREEDEPSPTDFIAFVRGAPAATRVG
jgi:uncharacterized damage-inducible protein DinB